MIREQYFEYSIFGQNARGCWKFFETLKHYAKRTPSTRFNDMHDVCMHAVSIWCGFFEHNTKRFHTGVGN